MLRSWLRWWLKIIPQQWQAQLMMELGSQVASEPLEKAIRHLMLTHADSLSPQEALRFLLRLDVGLYAGHGRNAVRYGDGVHVKHRLINYHNFFITRIQPNARVLDVGCGNGVLTRNMAQYAKVKILGIDIKADNITKAKQNPHPLVEYRVGDATILNDMGQFDVITLSNVLEHLSNRSHFLRQLMHHTTASYLLIRVPLFERDWRVPLKKELGVEWRLDSTHEIEYTQESFAQEMAEAGLKIHYQEMRWGEIWAHVIPLSAETN